MAERGPTASPFVARIGRPGRRSLGTVTGAKLLEVLFAERFSNWIQKFGAPSSSQAPPAAQAL